MATQTRVNDLILLGAGALGGFFGVYLLSQFLNGDAHSSFTAFSYATKMPNKRCDNKSNRWETTVSGWTNYEVVVYLKLPNNSMSSDGHIGLKHGGPEHTPPCDYRIKGTCNDKQCCCCWWDGGIRENGDVYLEIEYPHPDNKKRTYHGNIGRHLDNGKTLGVKWAISKISGGGARVRLWVDTSGEVNKGHWRLMYDIKDTGQKMPSSYKMTKKQNIEIRISDIKCKSIDMKYGPVASKK